jgi:hypothetical protein
LAYNSRDDEGDTEIENHGLKENRVGLQLLKEIISV